MSRGMWLIRGLLGAVIVSELAGLVIGQALGPWVVVAMIAAVGCLWRPGSWATWAFLGATALAWLVPAEPAPLGATIAMAGGLLLVHQLAAWSDLAPLHARSHPRLWRRFVAPFVGVVAASAAAVWLLVVTSDGAFAPGEHGPIVLAVAMVCLAAGAIVVVGSATRR